MDPAMLLEPTSPPAPPDEQHRARARWIFQITLGQEVPPAVWAALHLRVLTQADGTAAAVFTLNGLAYRVERQPALAGGAGGWRISCRCPASAILVVRHFQDALLVLIGAIAVEDPLPAPLPLACVA